MNLRVFLKNLKSWIKWKLNPIKRFPENRKIQNLISSFKKVYILGSAPSINELDLTCLDEDALIISMGNFFEHPDINSINPKIHIFAASHPPITKEVLSNWWVRCHQVLPKGTPLLIEKRDREVAEAVFEGREIYYYSYGGSLPVDFTKPILSPWSVTIVAIQLAIYGKIPFIGLLGVNHDWQGLSSYKHFYSHEKPSLEYYLASAGIEFQYSKSKIALPKERLYKEYELYQQYEALKKEAERLNIKIVNADPYSSFDVFDKELFVESHKTV